MIVTPGSLAMAGPAMAAISPSRDGNTVANAITDSLPTGALSGASFSIIPPEPGAAKECSDGVDNDGDGLIDFTPPAGAEGDPGCEASSGGADDNREENDAPPQCSNAFDDDEDGLTDFTPPEGSQDPGCSSTGDNDEGSEGQSITPECSDGQDNDEDGTTDFGSGGDPGCSSSEDNREQDDRAPECSNGLDDDGDELIDFSGSDPGCADAQDDLEEDGAPNPTPECSNGFDDDGDDQTDGADPGCSSGSDLDEASEGEPVPSSPECSDGEDNDGDGQTDFPGDPGCQDADDNRELDDEAPQCANGEDDDGDGKLDFAPPEGTADPGCSSGSDLDEGSEGLPPGLDTDPAAVSDSPLGGFPTSAPTFAILSSGNSTFADDPNASGGTGQSNGNGPGTEAHGASFFDLVKLKVDLNVPEGMNCLRVDFRFLSEEFPEYVGGSVNDGFVAELDTSNFTSDPNANNAVVAPNNFAFDSEGKVISINTAGFSAEEAAGTTYDGATSKLRASTRITPGTHAVYLSVFDQGDSVLDSAALIDAMTLEDAPGDACQKGTTTDTTPPTVTLTTPADDSSTDDTTPTYSGNAGDAFGDSNTVTVKVYSGSSASGTPVETLTATRSGTSWSVDGSTALSPGTYTAQAEQTDTGGNAGFSSANTFTITGGGSDTTPPSVSVTNPPNGSSTNDTTPSYSGGAGDAPGDSNTVTVKVYSGSSASGTPVETLTTTRSGTSWSVDGSTALSPGTYTAQAEQTDTGTNTGFSNANTFTIESPDTTPPPVSMSEAPPASTSARDATFHFGSSEPGATFECRLDGGSFEPCTSPKTYSNLPEGTHTFEVRVTDAAGNASVASHTWTITPPEKAQRVTLADLPTPELGKEVNVDVIAGQVLIALPLNARASGEARASQKGLTFVPLQEARQVPIGSFLDTRKGTVRLQSATGAASKTQQGDFATGLFQVLQSRKKRARGLTDLLLKGGSFNNCGARPKRGKRAQAALSRRAIRRLRSNASGRFRTRGRYSAATVRGTKWTVTDRCDNTLTKVTRGKVAVRDFRRKKTVLVRAGKSYVAKATR